MQEEEKLGLLKSSISEKKEQSEYILEEFNDNANKSTNNFEDSFNLEKEMIKESYKNVKLILSEIPKIKF